MKVIFRKETEVKINLEELMLECIDRLNWQDRRIAEGRSRTFDYQYLSTLVRDSIEFLYPTVDDISCFDNDDEVLEVICKNLLLYCVEKDYLEELERLQKLEW